MPGTPLVSSILRPTAREQPRRRTVGYDVDVTKAVVLTGTEAGAGWPGTEPWTRQLLPVANRPVLFHTLDAIAGTGLSEVAILVTPSIERAIRDAVGDGSDWGLDAHYVLHAETDGSLKGLQAAAPFLGDEPFLVQGCDLVLRQTIGVLRDRFAAERWDALALRVPRTAESDRLTRDQSAHGGRGGASAWFLGPHAYEALREESGLNADLNRVVAGLRDTGGRVGVAAVDGCLPFTNGHESYLSANRYMLEHVTTDYRSSSVVDAVVQGPVVVHPTARLERTLVRGPAVIGPRARLSDAYVGPYSSIGADVVVEGSEIEHSVVLAGAQLLFVGSRLESSVIGRGARVDRDFSLPRAMRLAVGDQARVTLT
jgi:glucose-1-phosphate thymidylyltransferase